MIDAYSKGARGQRLPLSPLFVCVISHRFIQGGAGGHDLSTDWVVEVDMSTVGEHLICAEGPIYGGLHLRNHL